MGLKIGTLREIGAKKGDVVTFNDETEYRFTVDRVEGYTVYGHAVDGLVNYDDNWSLDGSDNWRIASPAETTGPVRTVTRKEIVIGQYGIVNVEADRPTGNPRIIVSAVPTPAELRAAIATLTEIADALEEQA